MLKSTQTIPLTGTILCQPTDLDWKNPFLTFKTIEEFFVSFVQLESLNVTVADSYQPQIDFSASLETDFSFDCLYKCFLRRFEREDFAVLSFSKEAGPPFKIYGMPDTVPGECIDRILSLDLQVQRSDRDSIDAIRTQLKEFAILLRSNLHIPPKLYKYLVLTHHLKPTPIVILSNNSDPTTTLDISMF
ncbi:hypothetical protein BLNAU_10193 [Blattamonas nauphoetae]|uniref:Uncharacterized protein n=1 Tax=Blattamonas nauphoetae TaxID=2049346 RepID=A0ABQ9XTR1_9EUKA|nr:hypothetical protein BLNAU_10193 [Blattamonas nauphoetae]